jgi:hypothetical protein
MSLAKKRRARAASGSNGSGRKLSSSTTGCTRSVKPWPEPQRMAWEIYLMRGRQAKDFKAMPDSFEAGWKACVEYVHDFVHNAFHA